MDKIKKTVLDEDIEIISDTIDIEQLKNKTVLVTGATGLIGSLCVKSLLNIEKSKHIDLKVVAWARSSNKAENVFKGYMDADNFSCVYCDISDIPELPDKIDYIIHTASATASKYFVSNPVETIQTALNGTNNILKIAQEKNVEAMIYLSSLEVYGTPDASKENISENDYGYIDPLNPRSSYSEGKRMVECLCSSYASEYGVNVKIARLSQTFGAGVEYNDGRVFAEFARCAIEKKDIVLHTMGNTVRTYCYTADAVTAIFKILFCGETGRAYNVTNRDTACSIKEMAELVCKTFSNSKINVKIEIPKDLASFGYNPEMIIKINPTLLEHLGWNAHFSLDQMYVRTVRSMLETK